MQRCDRFGSYRIDKLIERYGTDNPLVAGLISPMSHPPLLHRGTPVPSTSLSNLEPEGDVLERDTVHRRRPYFTCTDRHCECQRPG